MQVVRKIVFFLPLYFLALGISPNFTADSILRALITIPLFIPGIIQLWIRDPIYDSIKANLFSVKTLLSLIITAVFVYLQLDFPILILIAIIGLVISWGLEKVFPQVMWYFGGMLIFYLNYLNINTFDFDHILRWNLLLPALFSFSYFGIWKNKFSAIAGTLAMVAYFILNDFFDFAFYTLLTGLFVFSGHYNSQLRNYIEFIGGIAFTVIFICYLLFGVNLIQAL